MRRRRSLSYLTRTASRCRRAYSLPLWFFFFLLCFFRCLISEVIEQILTKLGHIFTHDRKLKNLVRTHPGIYPHGLGAKNRFLGLILNFDRTYICNGTLYQQSEKKLFNVQGLFYVPPNLVNFGSETAPGVGEFLPIP